MGKEFQNRDAAPTAPATLEDVVRDGLGGIKEVMEKKTEDTREEKTKDADTVRAEEQKAIADEHLKRFENAIVGVAKKVEDDLRAVNEKIDGIDQRLKDSPEPASTRQTPSLVFVNRIRESDVGQRWAEGDIAPGQAIKGLPSIYGLGRRDDEEVIVAADVGSAAPPNYRIPGIQQYYQHEYGLSELMFAMAQSEVSKTAEWIYETETGEGAHIAVKCRTDPGGVLAPTDTIEVEDDASSFVVGSYIKVKSSAGVIETVGPIDSVDTTPGAQEIGFSGNLVDFDIDVGTPVFSTVSGAVDELGNKPYGYFEFKKDTESMKMIPIMGAVTRNQIMDVPGLQSYIEVKMRQRALRNLSWHLLYGDGSEDDQLSGLTTATGAQTLAWSDTVETSNNRLDAIILGLDKVMSPGVPSLVMRKDTLRKISLEKDGESRYLHSKDGLFDFVNMGPGNRRIGPYPVIIDQTMAADYVLCVDLSSASQLFYHPMGGVFMTGWKNDDFERNIIRVRYEDYLAHGVKSLQSYITVYLDNAPT